MALISCPECGKEVSDKVKACPHCGYPFAEDIQNEDPQKVEVTSVNLGPKDPVKKKKILTILAIGLVVIIGIVTMIFAMKRSSEAEKRAEYINNLALARITMLTGAAESEALCNLTKSVWYNTIYEKYDSKTDKYTRSGFSFNKDFNTSLATLYADEDILKKIESIKSNQDEVAAIVKKLQNPPEDLYNCYTTADSMYEAYQSLTELAISPSGSLTTYSSNCNTSDSDFLKYYQKLETQIPEE